MSRTTKKIIWMMLDSLILIISGYYSYTFLTPMIWLDRHSVLTHIVTNVVVYLIIATMMKVYQRINRYTSVKETLINFGAVTLTFMITATIYYWRYEVSSVRFTVLSYLIAAMVLPGMRILWRIYSEHIERRKRSSSVYGRPYRTLIVGAGDGGSMFIRHMKDDPELDIVGLVDDSPDKLHAEIYGYEVLGCVEDIEQLTKTYDVDQITIAIPSLDKEALDRIIDHAGQTRAQINQMPSLENVIAGNYKVNKFKDIEVVDLLGRSEVELDTKKISQKLINKTVLISGAGGSIGSEMVRQVIEFVPRRIVLLGHDEFAIYQIHQEMLKHRFADRVELVTAMGDIRDRERMFELMNKHRPDVIYHAAAHKHVPLMEANPREAVKNNVFGTLNLAEAAKACGASSFVMISTDKAVNPPNVMGATKRMAEMIVTGLNEPGKTVFSAVRFGNVLGSSGSVVPLFKKQIKAGGPVTVTDFRMTRFFMTISEASRLVIQAGSLAKGGEIFVLDMGEPVKIYDMAKQMVRLSGQQDEIEIVEVGIRPGEKLYEEILTSEEQVSDQVYDKIFVGNVTHVPLAEVLAFGDRLLLMESEDDIKREIIEFVHQ